MDKKSETLVFQVAFLNLALGIHPDRAAQIACLFTKNVKIPDKYLDFADILSEKKALVLSECIDLNKHSNKLEDGKQLSYGRIYSVRLMELETLKTYIETHLKTGFIQPSKSPASTPILSDKKPDGSLCLCMDHRGLNNLTIKNRYPLPLIGKSLDRLG